MATVCAKILRKIAEKYSPPAFKSFQGRFQGCSMSENEDRERLLAEFFKSLGEVDEESQKLKEYQESAITIV